MLMPRRGDGKNPDRWDQPMSPANKKSLWRLLKWVFAVNAALWIVVIVYAIAR